MTWFARQAVVRMGPVSQVGRVRVRSRLRKVLFRGAEGETRVNLSSVAFYCILKHVCLT